MVLGYKNYKCKKYFGIIKWTLIKKILFETN